MPVGSRLYLSWWDFSDYLSDFEDLVRDGEFQKMDYYTWRELNRDRNNDPEVIIETGYCNSFFVMIGHEDGHHRFSRGDNSFGDFLFENLIDVKEDCKHDWEVYKKPPTAMESAKSAAINCGEALAASVAIAKDKLVDVGIKSNASSSLSCVVDSKVDKAEFDSKLEALSDKVQAIADKYNNKAEKEISIMKGFNFDFGPVNPAVVRMSIYGLAVKNKTGTYVSYDAVHEEIMDVDVFNFDGAKFLYKMPVAIKDVAIGDVIVHMNVPMFVTGKAENGKAVYAVDPVAGERKEIMLTKSPFGFNFVTKVINFLGNAFNADAENPFGNLGLMMMLSEGDNGAKDMLPLMLMANGGSIDMYNPLVMYALMSGDGKMGDMLPFLFMMNANKPAAFTHECKCGGNCAHGSNPGENQ